MSSNHPKLTGTYPVGLLPPSSQRFGVVKPSNHPELTRNCLVGLLPMHHSGSMRFGGVQQPQTHSKLPYRPASPASQEVRCGRTTLNSLETAL